MFASSRTTLLCFVALCLATTFVDAHDATVHRREHVNLNRMMKKRAPQDDIPITRVPIGAGSKPTATDSVDTESASSSSSSSSSSVSRPTSDASSSTTSSSSSTTAATDATSSSSSTTSGTESSTSETSSSTTSSTASSTSSKSVSTPAPVETPGSSVGPQVTTVGVKSTKTQTVDAAPTAAPAMTGATAKKKSNVLTILIATVASIGGIFIFWTVFRKWKLGSSKKFDQRLKPIDWQPTNDDDVNPIHRHTSTSSGHGRNTATASLPDHDFTAGPANLSPVGGYADLARGPSPQPQMHDLHRGPSFNRGYDAAVPLHHGGRY